MSDTAQDYQQLLSHGLQKQMVILGKQIALAKARHVQGLTVNDDGQVTGINEDPKKVVAQFLQEFRELSAPLVTKTMEPLLEVIREAPVAETSNSADPLAIKPLPGIMRQAPETQHQEAPETQASEPQETPETPQAPEQNISDRKEEQLAPKP